MGMTLIHRTRRENDCSAQSADSWAWLLWTYHGVQLEAGDTRSCCGWARSGLGPREALQLYTELAHFRTSTGTQKHTPASHAHIHGWSAYCVPPMHRDSHRHACCLQPTQANQTHKTGGMHEVDWCNTEQAGGHSGWFPGLLRSPHTQYDTSCICWLMTETPQLESHSSGLGCLHPCKKCRHHKKGKHFTPDQPLAPKCACVCQLSPRGQGVRTQDITAQGGVQTGLVMQWKGQEQGRVQQWRYRSYISRDFHGSTMVKNLPCNAGELHLIPGCWTKMPHVTEQGSPCATTRGSTHCHERPHTTQWRSCVLQWRPDAAKYMNIFLKNY